MSRDHRCEMTLCDRDEAQWDYVPCNRPATHWADTDSRTIHLCAKHADRWNIEHDDENEMATEVTR